MEIWKTINGFTHYQVSNYGRIKRLEKTIINKRGRAVFLKEIIMKPEITHNGYLRVGLYKNGRLHHKRIASLVAEAFLGIKPNGKEIDHIDGDKTNNTPENLRYVTHKENLNNPVTIAKRRATYERKSQLKNPVFADRVNRTYLVA